MSQVNAKRTGRRRFLRLGLGLGAAAAVGGGALYRATTRSSEAESAYAPWRSWREGGGTPSSLVRAAILAANAHNTQPWLFCAHADRLELFADLRRNLGAMDPYRREMHISLGCALENLVLAARADGGGGEVEVAPGNLDEPGPNALPIPVARVSLAAGAAEVSPLLAAIPHRHTDRGAYDVGRALPADAMQVLGREAADAPSLRLAMLTEPAARADFAAATAAATAAIIADADMIRDSDAWFRGTDPEIVAHRDGPTLDAVGLSPLMLRLARLMPPPSPERSHGFWLAQTRDTQLATASAFGLIAVRDLYDRRQAVAAGRLWQRLHLAGTLTGLAMQPINQLPERVDRERQLGRPADTAKVLAGLTGDREWLPTFAFRIGWPVRPAGPSPRRDAQAVMMANGCG